MTTRRLAVVTVVAGVMAISGLAFAILQVQPAAMEAQAGVADPSLGFVYQVPGIGDFIYHTTYDPIPSEIISGPGETYAELVDGGLEITLSDAWANTVAWYGPRTGLNLLLLRFDGPEGMSVIVPNLDFSSAPGFGPPGSGEPVVVEMVLADGSPIPLNSLEGGSNGLLVNLRLSIDGDVAENGATYGPAEILLKEVAP
jgi:hypothetical protein